MRANFVLSEVSVGLRRNLTMTIAMIITTAISLGLLGAGLLIYRQVNQLKDYYYLQVEVSIFLDKNITASERSQLGERLKSDPQVRSVLYESKERAYQRFREQFRDSPDLVNNTSPSALPESFRVKLTDPKNYQAVAGKYQAATGVDQVVDYRQVLAKLFNILGGLQLGALVVAAVQGLAAMLLIGNTVQVAAFSRRRETSIMKLVGASNWYVQIPFVIEAALAGLVGAGLAILALVGLKHFFLDARLQALQQFFPPIPWDRIAVTSIELGAVSVVVAGVTAWATLRFYVRV